MIQLQLYYVTTNDSAIMKKAKYFEIAVGLRKKGHSINEIAQKIPVSKSTVSIWLRDVLVSKLGKVRLNKKISNGQIQSAINKKKRKDDKIQLHYKNNLSLVASETISCAQAKILCAMIYWCEGNKENGRIKFVNSDPKLIRAFLSLFRKTYRIDEKKFRLLVHLHDYHDNQTQICFWSTITGIPSDQFNKSWRKANTGKRIRKDYQGCLAINYYDAEVAQDLLTCAQAFMSLEKI